MARNSAKTKKKESNYQELHLHKEASLFISSIYTFLADEIQK
jgi:hypothetical protein